MELTRRDVNCVSVERSGDGEVAEWISEFLYKQENGFRL